MGLPDYQILINLRSLVAFMVSFMKQEFKKQQEIKLLDTRDR